MPGPRELLEELYRDGTVVARADGSRHELFPLSIPAAEGETLRRRVESEGAVRTLEVGLGYGVSALWICAGLPAGARHVALDPNQATRFADCGLQLLESAAVDDRVEFHAEPSELALPRFLGEGRVSADDPRHGWAVLRTPPEPLQRPFDLFVDF